MKPLIFFSQVTYPSFPKHTNGAVYGSIKKNKRRSTQPNRWPELPPGGFARTPRIFPRLKAKSRASVPEGLGSAQGGKKRKLGEKKYESLHATNPSRHCPGRSRFRLLGAPEIPTLEVPTHPGSARCGVRLVLYA